MLGDAHEMVRCFVLSQSWILGMVMKLRTWRPTGWRFESDAQVWMFEDERDKRYSCYD